MNGRRTKRTLRALGMLLSALSLHQLGQADDATGGKYLNTNDNANPGTATFFQIGATVTVPTLTFPTAVDQDGSRKWESIQ
jgi:hypothetical protein